MRAIKISRLGVLIGLLALMTGCGYYLVPGRFQPLGAGQQQSPGEGTQMKVLDDGTVAFVQNRLEVSIRPITDEELNREFPAISDDGGGPADELPTNAFTYGTWKDPHTGRSPQRFSVFKVTIKNYEYPKVKFEPLQVIIRSSNGRTYHPWGSYDFEEYFRRFSLAFNGLGYLRYNERKDIVRRAKYPDDEFCFSGQTVEGYIIFPPIHNDVEKITFHIPALGIRYNFRNEPVETLDLSFRFKRKLRKVKTYDELTVLSVKS